MINNAVVQFDLDFQNKLFELQQLLDEATAHALYNGDHWKSEEGYVELSLPNYFQRGDGDKTVRVGIYSYLLGPHRMHYFDNIDKALAAVRQWYEQEIHDCSGCGRCS